MNIALNDICDLTIYGLRNELLRLKEGEFTRMIFIDKNYTLEMTKNKAKIEHILTRGETEELYAIEYNLDADIMAAFTGISQMVYKLSELRYPISRK